MKQSWWSLPLGVLLGLLSAGLVLWASRPERKASILLRPPPTPRPLVVDVDGEVKHPGLYRLPLDSRVEDAVQAAGGFTLQANREAVNQAARLTDGDHLLIPGRGDASSASPVVDQAFSSPPTPTVIHFPVNINTAGSDQLQALPGIGPVTAAKIMAFRAEEPFSLIEDIQKVPGIGPATFEEIQELITVGKE